MIPYLVGLPVDSYDHQLRTSVEIDRPSIRPSPNLRGFSGVVTDRRAINSLNYTERARFA